MLFAVMGVSGPYGPLTTLFVGVPDVMLLGGGALWLCIAYFLFRHVPCERPIFNPKFLLYSTVGHALSMTL